MPTRQPIISMTFVCSKCGGEATEERRRNRAVKICKPCRRARRLQYYKDHADERCAYSRKWHAENKDKVAARDKQRHADSREAEKARRKAYYWKNREAAIQAAREWEVSHPEEAAERKRKWREERLEACRAKSRQWQKDHPEECRLRNKMRRGRKNGSEKFTAKDIEALRAKQKGKCAACKANLAKSGYHIDHVQPVSKGGSNAPDNLQLLCPSCNHRKRAIDPYEWAKSIGRLFV